MENLSFYVIKFLNIALLITNHVECTKTPAGYFVQVDTEMRNMTRDVGDTARMNCEITGHPIPTYTWFKDQRPLDKLPKPRRYIVEPAHWGSRLKIDNVNTNDTGWYSCLASNHHDNQSTSTYLIVLPVGNLTGNGKKVSGSKRKDSILLPGEDESDFEDGGYDYDDDDDDEDNIEYEIVYMENGDVDRYEGATTKNQKKNQNKSRGRNKQDHTGRHFGSPCLLYPGKVCRSAFNNQTVRVSVVNNVGSHSFVEKRLGALYDAMLSTRDDLCTRISITFLCRLSFRVCDGGPAVASYVSGGGYYGQPEMAPLCKEDCTMFESERCSSEREVIRLSSLVGDYHNLLVRDNLCSVGISTDQPSPTCVWRPPLQNEDSSPSGNQMHQMAYISAILVTAVLAVCLVLIFLGRRRQQKKMKVKKQQHEMEANKRKALLVTKDHPAVSSASTASAPGAVFPASTPVWNVSAVNVTFLYPIGSGHFGPVYAAQLLDQQSPHNAQVLRQQQSLTVIAATLSEHADQNSKSRFECEMRALSSLSPDHPNVLKCMAVCTVGSPRSIIFEFVDGVDLKQNLLHLASSAVSGGCIDLATALEYCCQVARGFEYLAERNYYHGDLSGRNVLVPRGGDRNLRITNLGVSRQIYESDYCIGPCGQILPLRWCPTERVLLAEASPATEIWSFGILLWEIFSGGTRPYNILSDAQLLEEMNQGKQPVLQLPNNCPEDVCRMVEECWHLDPAKRVTAGALRRNLEGAIFRIFNNNVCLPSFNTLGPRVATDSSNNQFLYPFSFYSQNPTFPRAQLQQIGGKLQPVSPATSSSNQTSSTNMINSPTRLNHNVSLDDHLDDDDDDSNMKQYNC